MISYADEIVRWVILAGLSSPDIAREVFGTPDIDNKSLTDTVALIEAKERAARAIAGEASVAAGIKENIGEATRTCGSNHEMRGMRTVSPTLWHK